MEIHQLKSFIAVAEESNLTRAAERLFSSQPAVSAHIKSLEEELGVSLFERTARGMDITADGEMLLEKAEAIINETKALTATARNLQANPSGKLNIGVPLDSNDLKLDAISKALMAQYPDLQLEFTHSSSGTISKGILNGDLDVGFFEGVVESPLLTALPVGSTQIIVVGSPSRASAFEGKNWKDLEGLPWIFKTPACSYHQLMKRISKANDLQLNQRFVIDHEATCLHFVRNGLAISIANRHVVSQELENGSLIAWPEYEGALEVSLLCLSKRSNERAIKAFFHVTQNLAEHS